MKSYRSRLASVSSTLVLGGTVLLTACAPQPGAQVGSLADAGSPERCASLASSLAGSAPVSDLVVTAAQWQAAEALPAHCLVEGYYGAHEGRVGGEYRTGFRMRLPDDWNGRFFFQGGGGSNGVVGDATGPNGAGNPAALIRGYAVIAQDSGHDNTRNTVPDHQGELVFGFDPQARRDYGHASLIRTYDLGHAMLQAFYDRSAETNIFWGCSKGGQEGMAFAQRYPEAFDGIVAMAPGMSLPRAAIAEAWDVQAFAGIFESRGEPVSAFNFASLISQEELGLVGREVLAECDGDDGLEDGLIGAVGACTTARIEPRLRALTCEADATGPCLETAQIDALVSVIDGARNGAGEPLYAPFAWDSGLASPGWSVWKIGLEPAPPSLNILLGGASLAAVFTTPPTALPGNPQALLEWQMGFDFDVDAQRIYAVEPPFQTSAWQDVGMRSTDLSAFADQGGRLIVPHGVSDPVFSVLDTIDWWNGVNETAGGDAAEFARVFAVPGMNHCAGGPGPDRFDSLTALEAWVLEGDAPDRISASAAPDGPLAGLSVPLCPYPQIAVGNRQDGQTRYQCRLPEQD
ncbi:tannase/feruloyl esterase family alpha/beta hydrolase [Maricaulis parjimensis]|uniref:tannase/feruloyl esterase family alpha/beta hydrolase n=1 Tax=Maricaulis parjimensis TaxID=144023 RepID=UPI001939C452|nr:tannase/feruloyl esterase family alpha/beta hydrolase [Maricaulis parjimensis]